MVLHPQYKFSVFTKMWPGLSMEQLAAHVSSFGLDGVELPVRPGFPLEPAAAARALPAAANTFAAHGLRIYSVAGSPEESVFAGCAEAGIPLIRVCIKVDSRRNYLDAESDLKRELERISRLCETYNVTYGIQFHCDWFIQNSAQTMQLIESFDPRHIGAVWDAGHSGLAGEEPEMGLDIVWSHLCLINLKNAFYYRANGPEAEEARWIKHWTTGRHGLCSWKRTLAHLKKRDYRGVICLPAEYTEEPLTDRCLRDDIDYVKDIFAGEN